MERALAIDRPPKHNEPQGLGWSRLEARTRKLLHEAVPIPTTVIVEQTGQELVQPPPSQPSHPAMA
ncbi:hypothetical protein ABT373_23770 [Streptomyces sp. NPDC000070]|uniref:hypothetical protein n=1 Tax=Streptomyces sp. NPDC000070 TaxID=3154240 RepID=UPI00331BB627